MRKLNRYQLLELLIIQSDRVKELEEQLREAQDKLEARELQMTNVGSIAEASMQLSGVFEAAQKAADMYLETIEKQTAAMKMEAAQQAEQILNEAQWVLDAAKKHAEKQGVQL